MKIAPEILTTIDRCFGDYFTTTKIPGLTYAITLKGAAIHSRSFGFGNIEVATAMTQSTISRIASMTKSFAAVAALQLRDRGLLDLDAPISSILPTTKLAEPFAKGSLADLMAMQLDLPVDDPWADRLLDSEDSELNGYFSGTLLTTGRGTTECSYSNLSYMLLGRVISNASGKPLMDYISDEILRPLSLDSTVWNPGQQLEGRVARGYRVDCDPPVAEQHLVCRSDGTAFGGLWSTVNDIALWLEFLRGDRNSPSSWDSVLSKQGRLELRRPRCMYPAKELYSVIDGQHLPVRSDYGFGLVRSAYMGDEYISHSGGLPGYGSHMRVHTESGLGVVVLGNGTYGHASQVCASVLYHIISLCSAGVKNRIQPVVAIGRELADFILSNQKDQHTPLFSHNFWRDNVGKIFDLERTKQIQALGDNVRVEAVWCISGFEGEIVFAGSQGSTKLQFSLAPHAPAQVQALSWSRR